MPRYLTKSRFTLAAECPTKLYYSGKPAYVDRKMGDSFLAALADGGYQVGHLARLMHPEGVLVEELGHDDALERTRELLASEQVTIFEAALAFDYFFVRIDTLRKNGNEYDLVEVKAKSYSTKKEGTFRGRNGEIKKEFKPYLLDVAFQRHVARLALPGANVRASLVLVDKESIATVDGLNQRFRIRNEGGRSCVEVLGGTTPADLGAPILTTVNVDSQVDQIMAESLNVGPGQTLPFADAVCELGQAYLEDRRIDPTPSKACGDCQFRADHWPESGQLKSGFHECWAEAFGWGPKDFEGGTVLDLWNFLEKDSFIAKGLLKPANVTSEDLKFDGTDPGVDGLTRKHRQWYACHQTWPGGGDFFVDQEGIRRAMRQWRYPLHFIDFETSMAAIPFTRGKRPYQITAFQFSHHEMDEDGSVRHRDQWLLASPGQDPNVEFVRALRNAVSRDQGTIFRWAAHENTVLNQLRTELLAAEAPPPDRDELVEFIESITERGDETGARNMVDLCDLSGRFFFHPVTNGSASLKKVLPALMQCSSKLREIYSIPGYGPNQSLNLKEAVAWWQERDGLVLDPYSLLPPLFDDFSTEELSALAENLPEELRDGGAAMAAYARLQVEELKLPVREAVERGLLCYCELDTLAMAMAVQAWRAWA